MVGLASAGPWIEEADQALVGARLGQGFGALERADPGDQLRAAVATLIDEIADPVAAELAQGGIDGEAARPA